MTGQRDLRKLETALNAELKGRGAAGAMMGEPLAGARSSRTANSEDNVVRHPALHDLPPGHPRGPQASAAPQPGQGAQARGAMEKAALVRLVEEAIRSAEGTRKWYDKNASSVKKWSRGSRTWTIVLGVLGSLCHLVPASWFAKAVASGLEQPVDATVVAAEAIAAAEAKLGAAMVAAEANLGALGLVFFMLAGSLLLYDQVFGFSTAWMRYRLAELRLGTLIGSFTLEVEAELAKCGGMTLPADRAESIFEHLKKFVAEVDKVKIEETETWIAEFKASLLKIEQITKARGRSTASQGRVADSTLTHWPMPPLGDHENRADTSPRQRRP
jgi:hypothetical protein